MVVRCMLIQLTSNISNFRLKDYLTKTDVTIVSSYTDTNNETHSISTTYLGSENSDLIVGTTYSNTPEKTLTIDGDTYVYSHSEPANHIVLTGDSSENVITHYYDKLVTKNIYLVEERPEINQGSGNSKSATENVGLYKTATMKASTNLNISENRPYYTSQNYTYKGWTTGTSTNYNEGVGLNTNDDLIWTDDSDNIYLYYEKDIATVNVEIKRGDDLPFEENGSTTYTYTRQGFVGEKLVVTGAEIKTYTDVPNLEAFSNRSTLDNYKQVVYLSEKDATYTRSITLEPRSLNLRAIGIDFTSPSAITIDNNIYSDTATYKYNTTTTVVAPNVIGTWKNFNDETNGESISLDFTTTKDILVGYYKGVKPSEAYNVTTNYINIIEPTTALKTDYSATLNVAQAPNIPVNEDVTVASGVVTSRAVDFTLDHYEVEYNGATTIFDKDTDLNDVLPYRDANNVAQIGDYIVNVYYRPYSNVNYTEKLYNNAGDQVVAEKTTKYSVLYDSSTQSVTPALPSDEYDITVTSNATYSDDEISVVIDSYDIDVTTTYTPLVYDLTVNVINNASEYARNYNSYTFANVPVKDSVSFTPPNYENSGYYFETALMVDGSDKDILTNSSTSIVFDPMDNPTTNGQSYTMELRYNQLSTIIGTYTVYSYDSEPLVGEVSTTTFIGDQVTITLPSATGYQLTSAYLDGVSIKRPRSTATLDGIATKPYHYIDLIYNELNYELDVVTATTGGTGYGTGSYYEGEKVYIFADADEGYALEKVTVNESDVELFEEDGMIGYVYFIMPSHDVNVQVYFTTEEITEPVTPPTSGGGGGSSTGDKDKVEEVTDETDETDETETLEPTIPEKPTNPTPEDIFDLVNDPYYSLYRHYTPYISGYPQGTVQPNTEITRSEVIAVIYNLFGNGYLSDKDSLNGLSDIAEDAWFSDAVAFAVDFGVASGYSDGTFKPNQPISRAELAAIVAKFVDRAVSSENLQFSDVENNWATSSIQKLYEQGIVSGYEDGTFKPNATTKRSEFVSVVNRLIKRPDDFNDNIEFPDLPTTHWAYNAMMNAANGSVIDVELPESMQERLNK